METYPDTILPQHIWVRAMYDYVSEDSTSLSMEAGDLIQVITQLESGWWDGLCNGTRGWFPSNYCDFVSDAEARHLDSAQQTGHLDLRLEPGVEAALNQQEHILGAASRPLSSGYHYEGRDQDEEVFWIPQCKEDGTLVYFNTLTGRQSNDPFASPSNAGADTAPAGQTAGAPRSRGASSTLNGRHDSSEVERSGSEGTDLSPEQRRQRESYISDGASPATSLESLSMDDSPRRSDTKDLRQRSSKTRRRQSEDQSDTAPQLAAVPARFLDYGTAVTLTWDRILEDVRLVVERYKQAIERDERSNYVKLAEDISDHLRLLLAAASGTTDNHSGDPSIINSNRELYGRFRKMMSPFAKLILDSHIAAADYSPTSFWTKCITDVDAFMEGVLEFTDVVRQRKGEDIPRVFPGFMGDHYSGGNWRGNGLHLNSPLAHGDQNVHPEPTARLDSHLIAQMDGLRREFVLGLQRLAQKLVLKERLISYPKHRRMAKEINAACEDVLGLYRPWMANLESVTLAPFAAPSPIPQIAEFIESKKLAYSLIAQLVLTCQAVGAPLADEWAKDRGLPLEDRLENVKKVSAQLETITSRVNATLETLQGMVTVQAPPRDKAGHRQSSSIGSRSLLTDISSAVSSSENDPASGLYVNAHSKKLQKILGDVHVPKATSPTRDSVALFESRDMPHYLRLDHENEVVYNKKTDPWTISGATITGLIEQLTRHDTYQQNFRDTFLNTYQSFMTGQQLFECLVQRWTIQPPPSLSEEDYNHWVKGKQDPVRFRVYNVLKNWVEFYWMEEFDDNEAQLLYQIRSFTEETIGPSNFTSNRALITVLNARLAGEEPHSRKTVASYMDGPAPKLPKNLKKFKFVDIDPVEMARQFTIIQQKLYCQIKSSELLARTWGKKIKTDKKADFDETSGIRQNIRHANQVTNYMAEVILSQTDQKKRVAVLKLVIQIADACFQMANFATLTAVLSSLGMSAIVRMNRTHNALDRKSKERLEFLRVVMATEKNYGAYREALRNAPLPALPFLGIALQDMRFVQDGMQDDMPNLGLINFHKRTAMADQVRLLMSYQNIVYPFKSSAELQSYINDRVAAAGSVDLYELSLKAEPREREDEKIARLLSESGFL